MHQHYYNSAKTTERVATFLGFFFFFFLALEDETSIMYCEASKNDVYVHSILCLLSLNA